MDFLVDMAAQATRMGGHLGMEESLRRALSAARPARDQSAKKQAAVAVVLAGPGLDLLLIRRAEHPNDPWSGHMALPGGRRDPSDVDLEATAVRETFEEVGVDLSTGELLGELPAATAMSHRGPAGMQISPFVYRLGSRPTTHTNEEVAEVLWVGLRHLTSGRLDTHHDYQHKGHQYRFPAWDVEGRIVWGITHRILLDLARMSNRAEGGE